MLAHVWVQWKEKVMKMWACPIVMVLAGIRYSPALSGSRRPMTTA